jgi:hypothetical protein
MAMQSIDITGQRFGKLTAICMTASGSWKPHRDQKWLFQCDCGEEVEAGKSHVVGGATRSCGCLQAENARRIGKQNTTHGHAVGGKVSSEYAAWSAMRARCGNPDHPAFNDYGGRGITVCERWNDFANFLSDMGPKPSPRHEIDRINNGGNYEPDNCRWATRVVQHNNKRNNRLLTIGGRTQTIAQWARESSIDPGKLLQRVNAGWRPEFIGALLRIYRERAKSEGAVT